MRKMSIGFVEVYPRVSFTYILTKANTQESVLACEESQNRTACGSAILRPTVLLLKRMSTTASPQIKDAVSIPSI